MDTNDVRLVGKRSNAPLYLLLALVLLGLLGYYFWMQNRDATPAREEQQQEQAQDTDDIQDIAGIYAVANADDFHNENIELENVTVTRVVSDRLFYVSQGNEQQQLLVYLADRLEEGVQEGEVRIQQGQVLNLRGELKSVAQADIEAGDDYSELEVQTIQRERAFLTVTGTDT